MLPAETQQLLGGELRRGRAVVQHRVWLRFRGRVDVDHGNAEAAKRSPVSGAAHPGGDDPEADPFLTGFNGSGW